MQYTKIFNVPEKKDYNLEVYTLNVSCIKDDGIGQIGPAFATNQCSSCMVCSVVFQAQTTTLWASLSQKTLIPPLAQWLLVKHHRTSELVSVGVTCSLH